MPRVKDTGYVSPQEVYNYLVNVKGLSREHALGMLSNIQAESGFKIAVQEYGKPQGTGGIGLFQHTGPRRQALVKYTGGDVNDWTKQVDFALQEGVTKNYLAQKFETPEEASIWFTTKWERPANANQRAQERLKYLNRYSSFTGYESSYQPSATPSSQGTDQIAQQGVAQMPIPFEVVVAGKPQQVAFTYEDFQKALATTKKEEEKEQESEARQELKQEMTTQEAFLKAMESITLPSAEPQGNQQQFASPGTTGYEPLPIQDISTALPQMPNIFSTQLPEMQDGGKVYSVKGEKYYKGPDGNWYRGESMNPQQRIYDQGTLNYINTNAVSSTPTNQGPQGAPKPVKNQEVWKEAQKQGEQELAAKQFIANVHKQSGSAGLYMPDGLTLRPQAAQAADWVPQALMGAPIALEAIGTLAAAEIPFAGGTTVGTAANVAGSIHGATQVPQRVQDWQDVAAGNMNWKEAALKTGITGLEIGAGAAELYPSIYRSTLPGVSVESGKAFKTLYPQAQMMPSGYKTYGQTQYAGPVSVNKNFTWNIDDLKNVRGAQGLPEYMNPYLYSKEVMNTRMSPWMQAYYEMQKVEKAADRVIKRTTDDKIYYDIEGNVIRTPLDNQRKGGQVSAQDTKEMLDGIADILRQVNNVENRKAIAKNMIGDFNREGLDYNLNNFLRNSEVKMQTGGSSPKPPKFSFSYNPYVYNPNELTGYKGYGNLSGMSLGISTPDLLGREKNVNALKVPFSASVNRLYDTNVQNTATEYSNIQYFNQDLSPEYLQAAAQQQLASASQPYTDKSPIGFNIQTGVSGSGVNPNRKKRTRIDAIVSAGYNPLSGLNAGVNSKFAFAFGNDFYRPLKNTGDWRVAGNIQPFGMSVSQQPGYSSQDAIVQSNLEQMAETGIFADATQNNYGYDSTKPGLGSSVQFTFGAGIDGSVKLPIGMLNAGAGVKYNRAAGEEERLAPTAYAGYSISGAELSKLRNKLPQVNLSNLTRSNYETLASQDLEDQKGEWVQGPDGKFVWRDFPGFNGAVNASTFEGEDIYVPSTVINQRNGGIVQTFQLF
jgi:hypothetical protein